MLYFRFSLGPLISLIQPTCEVEVAKWPGVLKNSDRVQNNLKSLNCFSSRPRAKQRFIENICRPSRKNLKQKKIQKVSNGRRHLEVGQTTAEVKNQPPRPLEVAHPPKKPFILVKRFEYAVSNEVYRYDVFPVNRKHCAFRYFIPRPEHIDRKTATFGTFFSILLC